jgi:4-amino-4-deoxy-L-arabinose transferase-like glycosyltransferase
MTNRLAGRREFWFALVLAVAVAVRLWHLASWDLWTDEMHTLSFAQSGKFNSPAYSTAPINFVLTRWTVGALGYTPLAGRTVPALAGALTVLLMYFVGRRWINDRAGLIAAALVGLSSWHVYWSQTARHFALAALFDLLALHAFLLYWRDGRKGALVALPFLLLLGLFTHSSSGFYLAALVVFVLAHEALRRTQWWSEAPGGPRHRAAWALAALGLAFAVYLPIYLQVGRLLLQNTPAWNPSTNIAGSFVFYLQPSLVLAALAGVIFAWREREDLGLVLAAQVVVPIVLVLAASLKTTASAGYCLASLFSVALLAGLGLDRIATLTAYAGRSLIGACVTVGVLLSLSLDLALYHLYYNGYKPRWREVAEYVASRRSPGDDFLADESNVVRFYTPTARVYGLLYVAETFGTSAYPPRDRNIWIAAYAGSEGALQLSEAGRRFASDSGAVKAFFPLHYGPKERTIAVYFIPAAAKSGAAPAVQPARP